jgi:hypothetical protein
MPDSFHDFWLRDLEFSSNDLFYTVKSQSGIEKSKYIFFPGCQMGASNPEYITDTYRFLLGHLKDGVGLYLGCCGAPAEWAGRSDLLEKNIQLIRDNWEKQGRPEMILGCTTCHKIFRKYLKDMPVASLWNIFNQYDLPKDCVGGNGKEMAVYDPCSSRYLPDVQKSIRSLMNKMGYKTEELAMSGKYAQCCGYGGLIATVNPKLAKKITDERINASAKDYVTYCTNCRDDFVKNGKNARHLLDMIFSGKKAEMPLPAPPSRSQRLKNRTEVKKRMLEEFWGEKTEREAPKHEGIHLFLSDGIVQKMDDRFILEDELRQVVCFAEENGNKLISRENGHIFAHKKIGHVTYWVEYTKAGDGFEIVSVYSHRIQLVEENIGGESEK